MSQTENVSLDLELGRDNELGTSKEQRSLFSIFNALWRHKFVVMAIVIGCAASVAIAVFRQPYYYSASATIMIEPRKQTFSDLQALVLGTQVDMIAVRTQVEVLQSPVVALEVVKSLHLVDEPEFVREIDAQPSRLNRLKKTIQQFVGQSPDSGPPTTAEQREQAAAGILLNKVSIRNDGRSYLVNVQATSGTADLSARLANGVVHAYLNFDRNVKVNSLIQSNARLDEQLAPLKNKVAEAEDAVESFRQSHDLVADRQGDDGVTVAAAQLTQLTIQLVAAAGDRAQKEAGLNQIRDALRTGRLDTVPDVVASALIQQLRAREADIASHRASMGTTAMSGYPALNALDASQSAIHQQINAEIAKIAASRAAAVDAARAQEASIKENLNRLKTEVSAQSQAMVKLRQLQSQADAARSVYNDYLRRFQQTGNQDFIQQPDAELVSSAQVPRGPSGPVQFHLIALSIAVAFVIATLVALLLDRMRQGFHGIEEFEANTGIRVLGFIPKLRSGHLGHVPPRAGAAFLGAVNIVRSALLYGGKQHRAHIVLITSAVPGEGKTFFAASLASSVSRIGGRSLIVDCDFRRSSVLPTLGVTGHALVPQSSDSSTGPLFVRRDVQPGLDVGSLLPRPGTALPPLRLIREEIERLRSDYSLIVLDAPPVIACAEADALFGVADGAILVVRWASTPRASVRSAIATLRLCGLRILGGIITQVELHKMDRQDGDEAYLYRKLARYYN